MQNVRVRVRDGKWLNYDNSEKNKVIDEGRIINSKLEYSWISGHVTYFKGL